LPTTRIASGRRDDAAEVEIARLHLLGEIFHAHGVGAGSFRRFSLFARRAEHGDANRLAVPCGSITEPRTPWSDFFASMPRRIATSTDSGNFAFAPSLTIFNASSIA
jgi:hypothetical protein